MSMKIPNLPLSRTPDCRSCSPILEMGETHVPCPAEFCLACSADLRVKRLRVSTISYVDAWRKSLCETAFHAFCGRPTAVAECNRLQISPEDRAKLSSLYVEGTIPEFLYAVCGLEGAKLVGITAGGVFLYAKPDEYAVGPVCWQDFPVEEYQVEVASVNSEPERDAVIQQRQVGHFDSNQGHRRYEFVYRRTKN